MKLLVYYYITKRIFEFSKLEKLWFYYILRKIIVPHITLVQNKHTRLKNNAECCSQVYNFLGGLQFVIGWRNCYFNNGEID